METLKGEYPNSRNGSSKSFPPYFAPYYLSMGFSSILIKISFTVNWEDPLEEEIVIHSSILAWEIPQTEESGGQQSEGSQTDRHD